MLVWIVLVLACVYIWVIVYSLYLVLADLTKLEDLAHLRVSFWICTLNEKCFEILIYFIDGYNGIRSWLNESIVGWLQTYHTTHYHDRFDEIVDAWIISFLRL